MATVAAVGLQLHSFRTLREPSGPAHLDDLRNAPTETRDAGVARGLGLFAVEAIEAASLVLADEALLSLKDGEDLPELFAKYEALPFRDRLQFESLSRVQNSGHDQTLALKLVKRGYDVATAGKMTLASAHFMSNAFNFTQEEAEGDVITSRPVWRRAVFPNVARINHSCVPNAHAHYRRELGSMFVFALRDIDPGEEIVISYFNITLPRNERQERAKKWGFTCTCPACSDTSDREAHEQLLARVRGVKETNARLLLLPQADISAQDLQKSVQNTMELIRSVWEQAWLKPQMPEMWVRSDGSSYPCADVPQIRAAWFPRCKGHKHARRRIRYSHNPRASPPARLGRRDQH